MSVEINNDFFTSNRLRLINQLNDGLVVVSANSLMQRSGDTAFIFDQESNFWYLTGINEPNWQVIIDGGTDESWLVSPELSETNHMFDGGLSNVDAPIISGIENILTQKEAANLLNRLSKKHETVHTIGDHPHQKHFNFAVNPAQQKMWLMLESIFDKVKDCRPELAKMRAIKHPTEIVAIKKAIKLTCEAFEIVKQKLPSLKYEYEVEAEFGYYFRKHGATGHAYDPIVAVGKNACTLHYSKNSDKLSRKELLLIDIGARVGGYAADITRTYSLGGSSDHAIKIHAQLEQAHKQIISLLKPNLLISDYQAEVDKIMKRALVDLGLITSVSDSSGYRRYFPHAISHGLGIDVHDSLGSPDKFLPGMVITVEPGIYIPKEGIGLRIEDDILITDTGYENLSESLSTGL